MPVLGFSDAEMDVLTALASALPSEVRDGFLQLVASQLAAYPPEARGVGLTHRVATEAQRGFLNVAVGRRMREGRW
jgi:hypothetical protein